MKISFFRIFFQKQCNRRRTRRSTFKRFFTKVVRTLKNYNHVSTFLTPFPPQTRGRSTNYKEFFAQNTRGAPRNLPTGLYRLQIVSGNNSVYVYVSPRLVRGVCVCVYKCVRASCVRVQAIFRRTLLLASVFVGSHAHCAYASAPLTCVYATKHFIFSKSFEQIFKYFFLEKGENSFFCLKCPRRKIILSLQ